MRLAEIKFYFVLFFCFSAIFFFEPVFIPSSLTYYTYILFFLTSILIFITFSKKSNASFSFPIALILIAQTLAAINATVSWSQDLSESIRAVLPQMSYFLFFVISTFNLNLKQMEKLILILGFSYIAVFLFSYLMYPESYFGDMANDDETRGFQRIRSSGVGFLYLLSFFSLSEYVIKRKYLWLLVYFLTMFCIIMTLSRISIICSILLSSIFYFKNSVQNEKYAFPIVLFVLILSLTQTKTYELLVEETISQKSYVNDDIRVQSLNYYLKEFSPNTISKILGNGVPGNPDRLTNNNREYAKFVSNLENIYHLYISDIGYFGLFVKFGLLSIIAYLIFFYKTVTAKLPLELKYSKYFLFFIFLISFIVDAPFNTSYIPSMMLAYYILGVQKNLKSSL